MIHFGDITKISGYDVPTVDVIIGGSPCQGLSIAGERAGLDDERSGLFIEQIRIVKEMRENDIRRGRTGADVRPRYMVWENVPGAFSSNDGEDFHIVLEETAKIADKDAVIPEPPKGKWTTAGCIMGDGWSIAWRVLDAQFWGVPQRRRRIALVADFGGQSAPEILFVRNSLSGNIESGKPKGEGASSDAEGIAGTYGQSVAYSFDALSSNSMKSSNPSVFSVDQGGGKSACNVQEGQAPTLTCTHGGEPAVCYSKGDVIAQDRAAYNQGKNAKFDIGVNEDGTAFPCIAKGPGAVAYGINGDKTGTLDASYYKGCGMREGKERDVVAVLNNHCYIVRRLTPLECERLQGFPDGWTDIGDWVDSKGKKKQSSDAARYKALGNSIALPPWKWVLKRLCACYERDATMASLFDGIGGFPLIWEQLNGKGSCLWASEIEEFPIAVTKARFGECT